MRERCNPVVASIFSLAVVWNGSAAGIVDMKTDTSPAMTSVSAWAAPR